jgi:hypothetical protein
MTLATGFVIIPCAVADAQERGIITPEMADCLSLLYRWREHDSNIVREVSGERLKQWLSLLRSEYGAAEKKWPDAETVRRWMRGLWEAGWFTRDYHSGVERPYNVYLQIMGGCVCNFVEYPLGRPRGWAEGRAQNENEGRAHEAVTLSNIKHWKQTSAFQGRAKDSTSLANEEGTRKHVLKDAKDQHPFAALAAGVPPAAAAGTIEPPPPQLDAVQTCWDVSPPQTPTLSNQPQDTSKASGKGKLLKALAEIAATDLHRSRGVPAQNKPRFDLIERAHGFDAVVADFREWCKTEPAVKGFVFPVFEYMKIVDSRLGSSTVPDPSAPDAKTVIPGNNPQVLKIMNRIYNLTGWPPTNSDKVAELIAAYGFDDVDHAAHFHLSGATGLAQHSAENVRKARQFLSEGGALVFITEYRKAHRKNTIAAMVTAGATKEIATAMYDAEPDQTRRQWSSALRTAVKNQETKS